MTEADNELPPACAATLPRHFEQAHAIAVGWLDASGVLSYANAGLRTLLGSPPDLARMVTPSLADLLRSKDPTPFAGYFQFRDGLVIHSLLGKVERVEGGLFLWAEYDVDELERINREITELNSEVVNLQRALYAEQRRLQDALTELKQTQAQLVHSEKMSALGRLVAGVAHEINNPIAFVASNLHSLEGSAEDLLEAFSELVTATQESGNPDLAARGQALAKKADLEFLQEDLGDLLQGSKDGLTRVQKIVADLRTFSRLDEADVQEADLQEGLRTTLALAGPAIKLAKVEVTLEADELPSVSCRSAELNQVFLNIIMNAVHALEAQPEGAPRTLVIEARAEPDEVVLAFRDSGCGIPAEVIRRVFDPFFTTKAVGKGTGLGLSLAHKIVVDQHGGRMDVESEPGQGTTFTIAIPRGGEA